MIRTEYGFARPISITDPMGEFTTSSDVIEGNLLVSLTIDPLGNVTHTEEDLRGHVVREVDVNVIDLRKPYSLII